MIASPPATSLAAVAIALISLTAIPGAIDTASSSAAPTVSLLNGKTFVAQSGEKGKQASNRDTVDGAAIRFHTETHSPTHGTMVWVGTVKENTVEATSVWTRERWYSKIKKEYWYRGQLNNENRRE